MIVGMRDGVSCAHAIHPSLKEAKLCKRDPGNTSNKRINKATSVLT